MYLTDREGQGPKEEKPRRGVLVLVLVLVLELLTAGRLNIFFQSNKNNNNGTRLAGVPFDIGFLFAFLVF
jgi:hypothetical protein